VAPSFADSGMMGLGGTPQMAHASSPQGGGYGHGMMMGYGHGPNMMVGYGPGGAGNSGWCHGNATGSDGDLDLTAEDVKKNLERHLAWLGNDRLMVGEIKPDGDNFIAHIVTKDNSLVERFKIDGDTGFTQRID
jgi:hypothetical protein